MDTTSSLFSLIDVNTCIKENDKSNYQTDLSIASTYTLESLAEALDVSLNNGGLNNNAIKTSKILLDKVYNQSGINSNKIKLISLESFKVETDRIAETKIAIESIKTLFRAIVNTIISAIKKSIEFIIHFFKSIFMVFGAKEDEIKRLTRELNKTTRGTPNKENYEDLKVINKLKAGGEINPTMTIDSLTAFSNNFFKSVNNSGTDAFVRLLTIIDEYTQESSETLSGYQFKAVSHPNGMTEGVLSGKEPKSKNLNSFVSEVVLPGDISVVAFIPKSELENEAYADAVNESNISLELNNKEKQPIRSLPILTKLDNEKLILALDRLAKEGRASDNFYDEVVLNKERLLKALVKFTSREDRSETNSISTFIRDVGVDLQLIDKIYVSGAFKISKLTLDVINAGIEYSKASTQAYK
jgi:hypothetical protein